MIIVEPYKLLRVTNIVNASPCVRSGFLQHEFNGHPLNIKYSAILGNVIHNVFQVVLLKDFTDYDFTNKQIINNLRRTAEKS